MSFVDNAPDFDPGARDKDNAIPEFTMDTVLNKFKSDQKGQPVYDDVEMVMIRVPGDRKTESYRIVSDEHRRRWPRAYAAFKAQQEEPTEGLPLTQWPGVTKGQVQELAFSHVKTVEQLAELPDDLLNKAISMGGFALREKARRYLESAKGSAPMEALAAENAAQKATIETMKAQLEDMNKRVDALTAQKASGAAGT